MNGACALCLQPVADPLPGGAYLFKARKDHVMALKYHTAPDGAQQKINEAKAGGNLDFCSQSIFNISKDTNFGFVRNGTQIKLQVGSIQHDLPPGFGSCIMINTCNDCIQRTTTETGPSHQQK